MVRRGKFKRRTKLVELGRLVNLGGKLPLECCSLKGEWLYHEEKETDVRIALDLLDQAYRDEYDKCILASGDSDLVPAIAMLLDRFPKKSVMVLAPPGQKVMEVRHLQRKCGRVAVRTIGRANAESSIIRTAV